MTVPITYQIQKRDAGWKRYRVLKVYGDPSHDINRVRGMFWTLAGAQAYVNKKMWRAVS